MLVTVHGDHGMVARGLATGALGFVLKLSAGDDLVPAVRAALRGERHVSSSLHFEDEQSAREKYGRDHERTVLHEGVHMSVVNIASRNLEADHDHLAELAVSLSRRLTRVHGRRACPRPSPRRWRRSPRRCASTAAGSSSSPNRPTPRNVHAADRHRGTAADAGPAPEPEDWLVDRLRRGELVSIARPEDLPRERGDAAATRRVAPRPYSMLGVPASSGGQVDLRAGRRRRPGAAPLAGGAGRAAAAALGDSRRGAAARSVTRRRCAPTSR